MVARGARSRRRLKPLVTIAHQHTAPEERPEIGESAKIQHKLTPMKPYMF